MRTNPRVTLEITKPAHPCKNNAGSFLSGDVPPLSPKFHPFATRMYAKVVDTGVINPGAVVNLQPNRT